jgi:hypothetical protein
MNTFMDAYLMGINNGYMNVCFWDEVVISVELSVFYGNWVHLISMAGMIQRDSPLEWVETV